MAIRITSNDVKVTGIDRIFPNKDTVLTVKEVTEYNADQFGGSLEPGVLDNLLTLCTALKLNEETAILNTYTTENGQFFGIPYVQLNTEGKLSLVFGKVVEPLVYNAKSKTYSIEGLELEFKPQAWINADSKEITAAFFTLKFDVEVSGLDFTMEYSISCKTKKEIDFRALVGKLQKGDAELSEMLQQLGKGGSYEKALKPFHLPRGFYQITDLGELKSYQYQGKTCFSRSARVADINPNTGEQGSENFLVEVRALPFRAANLQQCDNGFVYLFQIDGAYKIDEGKYSTIGYGNAVGLKRGIFTPQELAHFVKVSRDECKNKRKTIKTGLILTQEQVDKELAIFTTPKNTIVSTEENLVKVPQLDDLPF